MNSSSQPMPLGNTKSSPTGTPPLWASSTQTVRSFDAKSQTSSTASSGPKSTHSSRNIISIITMTLSYVPIWPRIKTFLRKMLHSDHDSPPPTPWHEQWQRDIEVEVQIPGHPRRVGVAMIDTQCPIDAMSCEFASLLGISVDSDPPTKKPIMRTVLKETVHTLGKVQVRWHLKENNVPFDHQLHVDPHYQPGVLNIIDGTAGFDVIIGQKTIAELGLLDRSKKLIGPYFRGAPPKIDESKVPEQQEAADKRRQLELEAMKRDQEKKDQK
ncbi:hypothetical protein CC80DRAFT_123237 [Byssothecium circinans]|uniref:Uncharacterized protein n=1 Tax=Byssothecium circinans TaxID=147558 RepID=A0A6A5TRP9_9PLEO|nr:hypothetical protein CC80DRAFT_123237 [Byssothecium circinans]